MSNPLTANDRVPEIHVGSRRGTSPTREDLQMIECTRAPRPSRIQVEDRPSLSARAGRAPLQPAV